MERKESSEKDYYVIDLVQILSALWTKLWALIIAGILVAAIGFSYASFFISPKYSASVMLYVNNSSFSVGSTDFSISSSEITAAQSLVKTYIVILKNRTTLEKIIKSTGVDYTYDELYGMIEASPVDDTEVFKVTVTGTDPYEAAKIANGISDVLPDRVSNIIEGSSMRLVDKAVANVNKVAPSITKYTIAGFVIGVFISAMFVIIAALKDATIHDEDYILDNYDFPVLAKIPDMNESDSSKYKYYSYYKKSDKSDRKRG